MGSVRGAASNVGIQAFNAMNQSQIKKKIQRPIDRRRLSVVTFTLQNFEQFISANGLMILPD